VITLYDAARCPYCARVRIVLAEKGIEVDVVEIDLRDRPDWIYEKNPSGRVPIVEEDGRPLWRLTGVTGAPGQLAVCNVYSQNEADRDWAVRTWQSLRHGG